MMKVISLSLLTLSLAQDCDYIEWEEEVYYASRDLMNRVQKPIGVCHTDNDPKIAEPGGNSSIIFTCNTAENTVEMAYYDNQYCSGEPAYTDTLSVLMTRKGII